MSYHMINLVSNDLLLTYAAKNNFSSFDNKTIITNVPQLLDRS